MKKKFLCTVLCAALVLTLCPTALAADTTTVRYLGLTGAQRLVQEQNPTLRALKKTIAGADTSSDIQSGYNMQGAGLESQIASYESMIESLEAAVKQLGDSDSALKQTYEQQMRLLKATLSSLKSSLDGLPAESEGVVSSVDDMVYSLKKQAENLEKQLCMSAQTSLITLQRFENSKDSLARQIESQKREITVLETKLACGMVSQLTVENAKLQLSNTEQSLRTLESQCDSLSRNLALLCGCDSNTVIEPSGVSTVSDAALRSMNYDKDLESALANSHSIWQKQDALRSAKNAYDRNISGTAEAVQSAEHELEATRESVRSSFLSAYQTVGAKKTELQAAKTELEQAGRTLETNRQKYACGMLSQMDYRNAEDAYAAAEDAVQTAELELLSAYTQYSWAVQGVMAGA